MAAMIRTHPALLDKIRTIYDGGGLILWGASFIRRRPGQVHHWHTDIESSSPKGGFVSVWIGLKGTNQASALKIVPRSHHFGKTIQEIAQNEGNSREEIDDACILSYGQSLSSNTEILQPEIQDGDAIIFDGRLWHGSANTNAKEDRYALLLQYARSDRTIQIPDFDHLSWPFQFVPNAKAPCIRISGKANATPNTLAEPPPDLSLYNVALNSTIQSILPEVPLSIDTSFHSHPIGCS